MGVTVPANTTATVFLPVDPGAPSRAITEGGRALDGAEGVRLLRIEKDRAVVEVESGSYQFAVETPHR